MYRDKPFYNANGISSIRSLSKTLDIPEKTLVDFSKKADKNYHEFEINKKDESTEKRKITEPKYFLKKIQKRINSRIFSNIIYPSYLHGGIRDKDNPRDYFSNAHYHTKSEVIHIIDIENYYPSIKSESIEEVFKHFFKFPPGVASILTKLVVYKDHVPQGSPTSSHLANLLFYDKEYKLVSSLRGQGIAYSRLLDDITVSSKKSLSDKRIKRIHDNLRKMIASKGLKVKEEKTKTVRKSHRGQLMHVTGLWVNHATPKCGRLERKNIRAAVHECEKKYEIEKSEDDYHRLWYKTSGRVAKLQRLKNPKAKSLRLRLSKVYPEFSSEHRNKLKYEVKRLEKAPFAKTKRIGFYKRVNNAIFKCGVLSRQKEHKTLADELRSRLEAIKPDETYLEFWES